MSARPTKTQIESLSEWIGKFRIDDVPPHIVEKTKLQVMDCVASICAGFRSLPGKKIYNALQKFLTTHGEHEIIPTGEHWSIENAVYLHAALINALELDNFCYMGHLSESAFPVALAVSERTKASADKFLESLICAQEVSGRLAAYMAVGRLQGHMRSFIHRVGAAVATTKLFNCSSDIIANAIAISLSSPELCMFPASFSPDTKINCVSSATVEGLRSAFLAMEGFEAARDIIEHPAGFVKEFGYQKRPPDFWHSLGKTWVMDSISFKYYSSCSYSQGPVNAILDALKTEKIKPGDIRAIHLQSPILTVVMEEFSKPHYQSGLTPVNINFSTKRSVSAAILYGGPDGNFYADGADKNYYAEIIDLSEKVFIHHSWKQSVEMIKGLDACLKYPGYPGIFDIGASDKTMKHMKKVYRNRTVFHVSDFKDLFTMPAGYSYYILKRSLKSYMGRLGLSNLRSFELDLSKLQFKIGTVALIHTKQGRILKGRCEVPKGFAGDREQRQRVLEKFQRECLPIFGDERTSTLQDYILESGYPLMIALKKLEPQTLS